MYDVTPVAGLVHDLHGVRKGICRELRVGDAAWAVIRIKAADLGRLVGETECNFTRDAIAYALLGDNRQLSDFLKISPAVGKKNINSVIGKPDIAVPIGKSEGKDQGVIRGARAALWKGQGVKTNILNFGFYRVVGRLYATEQRKPEAEKQ